MCFSLGGLGLVVRRVSVVALSMVTYCEYIIIAL